MAKKLRLRCALFALLIGPASALAPGEAVAKKESPERVFCSRQNVDAYREQNDTTVDKSTGEAYKKVVDLEAFYREAKKNNTLKRYAQSAEPYAGTDAILNLWNSKYHLNDHRPLAYILASVWHETGRRMHPVRESFASSDAQAISRLNKCCKGRKGFAYYWYIVKETGKAYFGRGHIQLTWDYNYKKADSLLGWKKEDDTSIYWNPDLALDSDRSAEITFDGMMYGWYRPGYCLPKFFRANREPNWNGARDIVNADYRKNGAAIGNYARAFNAVLEKPGVITTATALEKKQEIAALEKAKAEEEAKKKAEMAALDAKEREAKRKAEEEAAKQAELAAAKQAEQEAKQEVDEEARKLERQRRRDAARERIQKIERDVVALDQRLKKLDDGQEGSVTKLTAEMRRIEKEQSSRIELQGQSLERLSDDLTKLSDDMSVIRASQQQMQASLDKVLAALQQKTDKDERVETLQRKVSALEECGFWDHLFGCETGE